MRLGVTGKYEFPAKVQGLRVNFQVLECYSNMKQGSRNVSVIMSDIETSAN